MKSGAGAPKGTDPRIGRAQNREQRRILLLDYGFVRQPLRLTFSAHRLRGESNLRP